MTDDLLFKKVYGALIGAAIGDAMGGPVEMWDFKKIEKVHGKVDSLLPYNIEPNTHGPWAIEAGTYTDDTRMMKIFCEAIKKKKGVPSDKDITKVFADYFYGQEEGMPKEFIEEYFMKGIYREDKSIFGGQPTNGGIMGIAPFGIINACNPQKALNDAFDSIFIVEGYARYSAAIAASAIAAAMKKDATVDGIVTDCIESVKLHKENVEGERWVKSHMYPEVGMKNEKLIKKGIEIAKKYKDPYTLKQELADNVYQEFFADGSETLAIAITMFVAADGDFCESVKGAVNFGRDNDSSACVAGAIAGAFRGVDSIPTEWIELVESVNAKPTLKELAYSIHDIILSNFEESKKVVLDIEKLV